MKRTPNAERGFSLIVAMLVVVVLTLLVVGAIAFTGSESRASIQRTRAEGLSSCADAARAMFLARVRVLKGEVPTSALDGGLGPDMHVYGGHYLESDGGSIDVNDVQVVPANELSSSSRSVRDLSNWVGTPSGNGNGGGLYATYYRVTAVCNEKTGGPQQEVEFVMRVGL